MTVPVNKLNLEPLMHVVLEKAGSLEGIVVDKESQEGLDGVTVTLIKDSKTVDVVTEGDGSFHAQELEPGLYEMQFTKAGYGTVTLTYYVKSSETTVMGGPVEMEKENTQPAIWDTYYQLAENMTKAKKDTSIVVEAYERATDYLDLSILNATKAYEQSADALEALNAQLEKGEIDRMAYDKQAKKLTADTTRQSKLIVNYRKTLVKINNAVTPYASCEVLEMLYTKKF